MTDIIEPESLTPILPAAPVGAIDAGEVRAPAVALGPGATNAAAAAMFACLPGKLSAQIGPVLDGRADYLVPWFGEPAVPEDSKGRLWTLAPIARGQLPRVVDASLADLRQKARERGGRTPTPDDAKREILDCHRGVRQKFLAGTVAAFVEIDHLALDEQRARYAGLARAIGLAWTLWVFSGGKSIHAYFAFDRLVAPDDAIRVEIQKLLIAILEGDAALCTLGHPMRLPGFDGARKQPVLHLNPDARHCPETLRDALLAHYVALGGIDLAISVRALKLAKELSDAVKKAPEAPETAERIELAARLRSTRVSPSRDELARAGALVPARAEKRGRSVTRGGRDFFEVEPGTLASFRGLARGTRVDAPCCDAAGHSRSGAGEVKSEPEESPRILCYRCDHYVVERRGSFALPAGVTMIGGGAAPSDAGDGVPTLADVDVTRSGPRRVDLTSADLTPAGHVDPRRLRLRTGPTNVLVLALGLGMGKTEVAAKLVAGACKLGKTALAVAPIRTLSRALAARLGVPCYLDLPEGDLDPAALGGLSVCLPSVPRVPDYFVRDDGEPEPVKLDLLVLDESEQQLRSLLGDHLAEHQARNAYGSLVHKVRHAKAVVLMDADAGPLTRRLLSDAGREAECVWVTGPAVRPPDLAVFPKRRQIVADLLSTWEAGGRPYAIVASVAGSEALARVLRQRAPNRAVAVITRKTAHHFDLGAVNTWIRGYDAVIVTPGVLTSGVSIDVRDHFDVRYVIGDDAIGTATDVLQAVARVRHPKTPVVKVWTRHAPKPQWWESDAENVYDRWRSLAHGTARLSLIDYADVGRRVLNAPVERYLRTLALGRTEEVRLGHGRVGEVLADLVHERGGQVGNVSDGPPTDAERLARVEEVEARDDVDRADRGAVLAAKELTIEEARAIARHGPRDDDERNAIRRHRVEGFYGEVSEAILEFDRDGRGRAQARTYAHALAVADGGLAADAVRTMDRREIEEDVIGPRLRHRLALATAHLAILNVVGIRPEALRPLPGPSDPGGVGNTKSDGPGASWLGDEERDGLRAWMAKGRRREGLARLGIRVGSDFEERPLRFVTAILARMGIATRSRRPRSGDGTRMRLLSLDPTSIQEIATHSARYRRALASPFADFDDEEDLHLDVRPAPGLSAADAEAVIAMLAA